MHPPPPTPQVGMVLGDRYELTRHIARGGMGDVYEARDRVLERPVAVKVFRAVQPTDRARFDAEIHVLAGLSHPGLVQVYDAGAHDDVAFLVLELIDGPPLRASMQGDPMDPPRVAAIGAQVAEALDHIHSAGVVHRDVTPSNVLCGPDGRAKIVDFGIARLMDAPRVTAPQSTVGTAAYMSPEQVQGHEVTPASDVYSLGLVLLEALTGRKAFPGTAMESAVARLVRPPDTRSGVPGAWQPLLGRMTATEPTHRPSAAEVHTRLLLLTRGETAPAATATAAAVALPTRTPATRPRLEPARRVRRPVWAVAAALLISLASVVALSAAGGGGEAVPPASGDEATSSTAATDAGTATEAGRSTGGSSLPEAPTDPTVDLLSSTSTTAATSTGPQDPGPGAPSTVPTTSPPTTDAPPTSAPTTTPTTRPPTTTAAPTTVAP